MWVLIFRTSLSFNSAFNSFQIKLYACLFLLCRLYKGKSTDCIYAENSFSLHAMDFRWDVFKDLNFVDFISKPITKLVLLALHFGFKLHAPFCSPMKFGRWFIEDMNTVIVEWLWKWISRKRNRSTSFVFVLALKPISGLCFTVQLSSSRKSTFLQRISDWLFDDGLIDMVDAINAAAASKTAKVTMYILGYNPIVC